MYVHLYIQMLYCSTGYRNIYFGLRQGMARQGMRDGWLVRRSGERYGQLSEWMSIRKKKIKLE